MDASLKADNLDCVSAPYIGDIFGNGNNSTYLLHKIYVALRLIRLPTYRLWTWSESNGGK